MEWVLEKPIRYFSSDEEIEKLKKEIWEKEFMKRELEWVKEQKSLKTIDIIINIITNIIILIFSYIVFKNIIISMVILIVSIFIFIHLYIKNIIDKIVIEINKVLNYKNYEEKVLIPAKQSYEEKCGLIDWLKTHRAALAFITPPPPKKVYLEKPAVLDIYELYKEIMENNENAIKKERPMKNDYSPWIKEKLNPDPIEIFLDRIAELKNNYETNKEIGDLYEKIEEMFNLDIEELIKFRKAIQIDQNGLGVLEPLIKVYNTRWVLKILRYPDINIPEFGKNIIIEDMPIYKILIKNLKRMFSLDYEKGLYISIEKGYEIELEEFNFLLSAATQLWQSGNREIYKIEPNKVIFYGEPGSGKSTFLAYIGYYLLFSGNPVLIYSREKKSKLNPRKFEHEKRNIIIVVDELGETEERILKNLLNIETIKIKVIGTEVTYLTAPYNKYTLEFTTENEGKIKLKKEEKEKRFRIIKNLEIFKEYEKINEIYIKIKLDDKTYKNFIKKILKEKSSCEEDELIKETDEFFQKFKFFAIQIMRTYEIYKIKELIEEFKNAKKSKKYDTHRIIIEALLWYLPKIKDDRKFVEIDDKKFKKVFDNKNGNKYKKIEEIFERIRFLRFTSKGRTSYSYYCHNKIARILLNLYDDDVIKEVLDELKESSNKDYYEILSHAYVYLKHNNEYWNDLINLDRRHYLVNTYFEIKYSKKDIIPENKANKIISELKKIFLKDFEKEDILKSETIRDLKRWYEKAKLYDKIFEDKLLDKNVLDLILFFDIKNFDKLKNLLIEINDVDKLDSILEYFEIYQIPEDKKAEVAEILKNICKLLKKIPSSDIKQEIIDHYAIVSFKRIGKLDLDPLIEALSVTNSISMVLQIPFKDILKKKHQINISEKNLKELENYNKNKEYNYIIIIVKKAENNIFILNKIKDIKLYPMLFLIIGKYFNINKLKDIKIFENYINQNLDRIKTYHKNNQNIAIDIISNFYYMLGNLVLEEDTETEVFEEVEEFEKPDLLDVWRDFKWRIDRVYFHQLENWIDITLKILQEDHLENRIGAVIAIYNFYNMLFNLERQVEKQIDLERLESWIDITLNILNENHSKNPIISVNAIDSLFFFINSFYIKRFFKAGEEFKRFKHRINFKRIERWFNIAFDILKENNFDNPFCALTSINSILSILDYLLLEGFLDEVELENFKNWLDIIFNILNKYYVEYPYIIFFLIFKILNIFKNIKIYKDKISINDIQNYIETILILIEKIFKFSKEESIIYLLSNRIAEILLEICGYYSFPQTYIEKIFELFPEINQSLDI